MVFTWLRPLRTKILTKQCPATVLGTAQEWDYSQLGLWVRSSRFGWEDFNFLDASCVSWTPDQNPGTWLVLCISRNEALQPSNSPHFNHLAIDYVIQVSHPGSLCSQGKEWTFNTVSHPTCHTHICRHLSLSFDYGHNTDRLSFSI